MNSEALISLVEKKTNLESGALKNFRASELSSFKERGIKEVEQDSYKFTNMKSFFEKMSSETEGFKGVIPSFTADFPTLTFVDGNLEKETHLPEGVKLKRISAHFDEVKTLFTGANALSHLHHALVQEGVMLEIDKNADVKHPIRILNILTKSGLTVPTHFISAGANSKVTVLEETRGLNSSHALLSETYIIAAAGAKVTHIGLDEESPEGINHSSVFAEVDRDATVTSLFFHGTGKLNRRNLTLNLNSPGAHGESYALFLTNGSEHSDIYTQINHKAADTTSNQIAKGILDGESKGVFTGKIHIFPKAQRVASGQLNKNLLLSKKAQVHSQPQLEIFADDVKCSHGSTTGQLSDDEVFYFQARGIPEDKARTLLALGFGLEIVNKIENQHAHAYVKKTIMENLEKKFSLGNL